MPSNGIPNRDVDKTGKRFDRVIASRERIEVVIDLLADHIGNQLAAVHAVQDLLAVAVNTFALLVHDLVILEQVLANLEVSLFDFLLRGLDAARDELAFDPLPFLHPQPFENALHPRPGEDPHQVIFQRQVEAAASRIALPAAAAA